MQRIENKEWIHMDLQRSKVALFRGTQECSIQRDVLLRLTTGHLSDSTQTPLLFGAKEEGLVSKGGNLGGSLF